MIDSQEQVRARVLYDGFALQNVQRERTMPSVQVDDQPETYRDTDNTSIPTLARSNTLPSC